MSMHLLVLGNFKPSSSLGPLPDLGCGSQGNSIFPFHYGILIVIGHGS
jgi:hypothetical protein